MSTLNKDRIYEDYIGRVKGYIKDKVDNYHDAEDLTNTVFLKIYENLNAFDGKKGSLSTWIYTITRNTMIDYFRTKRELFPLYDEIPEEYITENIISDDLLDRLADALQQLSERERDLIILHYYSGFTLKQIGGMMNMPYITVKVTHRRALGKLRRLMCRQDE